MHDRTSSIHPAAPHAQRLEEPPAPADEASAASVPPAIVRTVSLNGNGSSTQGGANGASSSPGPSINLSVEAHAAGSACVQCGLCLPACPTYLETGNEADSPRGRIRQMLGLHEGDVPYTAAGREHLDRCLDCRSCETACPSGVVYHKLLEDARPQLERHDSPSAARAGWLRRWFYFHLFTRPNRLRIAVVPARLLQRIGIWSLFEKSGLLRLLPGTLGRMSRLLPPKGDVWPRPLPAYCRAGGMDMVLRTLNPSAAAHAEQTRCVVGFFEGCVAQVLSADVHRKAAELLCAAGADVISPPDQICCGAIHLHNQAIEQARDMARRNIDVYLPESGPELDYIVTCTAGDGAMLRQYAELLADDPHYSARARRFSDKVRDVTEVLACLPGLTLSHPVNVRVTYHDACHLAHGQKVTAAPRDLLRRIPGVELIELAESDICCGAAGTYNLSQPEMAAALGRRKLERIAETGCEIAASGNIGCTMHLRATATQAGKRTRLVHPVELLHSAAFG